MRNEEKTRIPKTAKIAATAAAAYGAYKLAYHLTAKKGKKPEWHGKVGKGHEK